MTAHRRTPTGRPSRLRRAAAAAVGAGLLLPVLGAAATPAAAADLPRVLLQVLVVQDGSPWADAVVAQLDREGVPHTDLVLGADRPVVDAAFLEDAATRTARFQAVVLPNADEALLSGAEMTALQAYEARWGVRELDAYVYPSTGFGAVPTYAGPLDGATATVTPAAKADGFGALSGTLRIDDFAPTTEVYGYLADPAAGLAAGETFTPFVTATAGGTSGTLVGVHALGGREEMEISAAANRSMQWSNVLLPQVVEWLTRGVHLGLQRNAFAVHVDDVFLPDSRWSTTGNCTPGDGCVDPGVTTPDIRMTRADVDRLVAFSTARGFRFDLVYNGGGADQWRADHGGVDALTDALLARQSRFSWVNHTSTHPYLGCIQIAPTVQGQLTTCATSPDQAPRQDPDVPAQESGGVLWASQAYVTSQIADNSAWGAAHGLTDLDPTELVTGEHSGLKSLPQQPVDNPFLAPALAAAGVTTLASDASREPAPRAAGAATTVPRLPMNVFYNTATYAELVDEYNWYYTTRSPSSSGVEPGSGICDDNPATSTCLPAPLDASSPAAAQQAFDGYLKPLEVRNALGHVLTGDPRPFYAHQSNLAEDGLLYPVVAGVLDGYAAVYDTAKAPLLHLDMTAQKTALQRSAAWAAAHDATAWVDALGVHVRPGATAVPLTVPLSSKVKGLTAYGTGLSGWLGGPLDGTVPVPGSGYSSVTRLPGAPAITSTVADNGNVLVSWTPPADLGAPVLSGYVVRAYVGDAATPVRTLTVGATALRTRVDKLVRDTSYTFTVSARSSLGEGPASARTAPVLASRTTRPEQVTGVTATPADGSAVLSWTSPATPTAPVLGYVVKVVPGKVKGSPNESPRYVVVQGEAPGTTVTGLTNGRPYAFEVAAANLQGVGRSSDRTAQVVPTAGTEATRTAAAAPAATPAAAPASAPTTASATTAPATTAPAAPVAAVPSSAGTTSTGTTSTGTAPTG